MRALPRTVVRRGAVLAVPVLLSGAVVGCSSSTKKPAVCGDLDALKASVQSLLDVQLSQGGLTKIKDDLSTVGSDLTKLKADAGSQYASQIAALENAVSTLGSDVRQAVAAPSATSLAAVASATSSVGTAAKDLSSAVSKTC